MGWAESKELDDALEKDSSEGLRTSRCVPTLFIPQALVGHGIPHGTMRPFTLSVIKIIS